MKLFKKIVLGFVICLTILLVSGYFYFDQKFTPEKNYLSVENESGKTPIIWLENDKSALFLPVHFEKDTTTYFLQFDTGSPYTVFYSNSIKNIREIVANGKTAKAKFSIGNTNISSEKFKIIEKKSDSSKIIGTLGSDILEDRKSIINFKENYVVLNLSKTPNQFQNKTFDFKFKKRKIIISGVLKNKKEKFLYDSGTSGYQLLTSKEIWQSLKESNSKVKIEKGRSWDHILTTYTTSTNNIIEFPNRNVSLNEVTYVEGFSKMQYYMMKFSAMTGMLGNKIFLNNTLFIDCREGKMGID